MKTKLIRSLAPFSAWKYSSLSFCRRQQFTKLWQFWSVIKYGGGGFQFIWFHSGNRIMNRLFASLPPKLGWGETKGKMMATKKGDTQTKDCHKDKADHSAVCIWKKGQKTGQNLEKWQKMAAQRQSSLEKCYELGPTAQSSAVAQGHLDSAQAVLWELIDQVGWQEFELNWEARRRFVTVKCFLQHNQLLFLDPEALIRMHQQWGGQLGGSLK